MHSQLDSHHPQPVSPVQSPQAALTAHGSVLGHSLGSQSHVAQVPSLGPLEVPVMHIVVVSHQPQPYSPVQVSQVALVAQGSGPVHSLGSQLQSVQVPVSGPAEVPVRQDELEAHQPQPEAAVQSLQPANAAHGSAGLQELGTQRQSAQEPFVGPVESPPRHSLADSHQPQPYSAVQPSQAGLTAQGSWTLHEAEYHTQSAQVPWSGPDEVPVRQVLVEGHHPQLAWVVQVSQASSVLQGSVGEVVQEPLSHVMPAQQSSVVTQLSEPARQAQ